MTSHFQPYQHIRWTWTMDDAGNITVEQVIVRHTSHRRWAAYRDGEGEAFATCDANDNGAGRGMDFYDTECEVHDELERLRDHYLPARIRRAEEHLHCLTRLRDALVRRLTPLQPAPEADALTRALDLALRRDTQASAEDAA